MFTRSRCSRPGLALLLALSIAGCDAEDAPNDGSVRPGADAARTDAGTPAPMPPQDAGPRGPRDGGTGDAGSPGGGPESCDGSPLTDWEQMMLDAHNRWRAAAEPAAANMLRVHWDRAIAANAAAWVASCDPDWPHSPSESREGIGGYDNLGENLSYCAGTGCSPLPTVRDGSGMGDGEGWWEERHDYDLDSDTSTGVTSHYTQLMSSNVYAMGCATQRCDAPGPFGWSGEWWWTICQYGPRGQGFWSGTRPYERGEGGLHEPPEGVYEQHPSLCRAEE